MPRALPPVDPSVKIPDSVKRAAAASDALQAQISEQQEPPAESQPPVAAQPEPQPPAQPPAPPPEPIQPPPQPQPPPPPPPPPPAAAQQQDDNDDSWKRRYEAAQGRVTSGARIISELNDRVGQLEMLLATQQHPPEQREEQHQRHVTDDDLNTYGDDFIAMVKRAAAEMIEPIKAEYEQKINGLGGAVQGVTKVIQQNSKDKMRQYLTENVSEWRILNKAPEFKDEWLMQVDDLTGQVRRDMLLNAWERNDAPRVAAFFQTFLREQAIQNGAEPTDRQPPAPRQAPAVSLGAFAAPGRAKQVAVSTAQASRQPISGKFITSFYADVAAGKYLNNEARKAEIERDIWAAQAENRITR